MDLIKKTSPSAGILELKGRFDAFEVAPVAGWIKEQLAAGKAHLVISLAGVNFIDSTALATLVQGLKHCREFGGDLHLCGMQQPVQIIFELTRLDKAFAIFNTEEEALIPFLG
ncbi:MAG: STAS domain-containing protein [Chloroflexota bacterium]